MTSSAIKAYNFEPSRLATFVRDATTEHYRTSKHVYIIKILL